MKLNEILDDSEMIRKLDFLNKDKSKSARTRIKLLRAKKRRNKKTSDTEQNSIYANHDAMTGYGTNTFDQNNWR